MHEVIEGLQREGTRIEDDWLRRIGPAHFAHINFRDTMRFGVEKCADALMQHRPVTAGHRSGSDRDQLTTVVTEGKMAS